MDTRYAGWKLVLKGGLDVRGRSLWTDRALPGHLPFDDRLVTVYRDQSLRSVTSPPPADGLPSVCGTMLAAAQDHIERLSAAELDLRLANG